MLTFFFSLSVGFYVGLVGGLIVALLAAVFLREKAETPAATAPRMVELFHADATNYRRN
jgi:hypothetical protein